MVSRYNTCMGIPQTFVLPFIKKEQIAKDTFSFYFDRTKASFEFLPGEYIRIILPHENQDDRGANRYFSIASSPLEREFLMITTKVMQSSFKHALYNLAPGTNVQFWGPIGRFIFDEKNASPHVFLSGGIGITPYHSILNFIAAKNIQTPVTFLGSFSTVEELIYYSEFTAIATQHKNIQIIYTITHPEISQKQWEGETGRISDTMIQKYVDDIQNALFYIVGPPKMVQAMEEIVKGMGVSVERIKKENFVGY